MRFFIQGMPMEASQLEEVEGERGVVMFLLLPQKACSPNYGLF
jgi:hypothetical protein